MAVTSRKPRSTPARRRQNTKQADPLLARRVRAGVGLSLFILGFAYLWCVDGNWTAENSMRVFGLDYIGGWVVHLIITAIQVLPAVVVPWLPHRRHPVVWLLWLVAVPVGVFNVWSSALGIGAYLPAGQLPRFGIDVASTMLGEVTAFLPEKAIALLFPLLHRVYRG